MPPSLFVNDGSFMERFKQLQQEQEKKNEKLEESKPIKIVSGSLTPNLSGNKKVSMGLKANTQKSSQAVSSGKLAFSIKQKSKLVPPPVKLSADDEEEADDDNVSSEAPLKRQRLGCEDGIERSSRQSDDGNCILLSLSLSSGLVVD